MGILDLLEKLEDSAEPHSSISMSWEAKGIGFGQFYFYLDEQDKKWHCQNECMSKEFIKRMFNAFVDELVLDESRDDIPPAGEDAGE